MDVEEHWEPDRMVLLWTELFRHVLFSEARTQVMRKAKLSECSSLIQQSQLVPLCNHSSEAAMQTPVSVKNQPMKHSTSMIQ